MGKPNFFIIGAPKCGTTSLAYYLSEHPQIFMSELKEPYFFSDDIDIGKINKIEEYEHLFENTGSIHLAIGEASTQYLFSSKAVDNILRYNPMAKFIVMLRNPVEMAYSLHLQQLYSLYETVEDFETAWDLQDARKNGRKIPASCPDPKILQYGDWCKLGQQVSRLLEKVEKERVLTILLDDLKENPKKVYSKVLSFLKVPDDNRKEFPALNTSKTLRSPKLQHLIRLLGNVKRALGIYKPLFVSQLLNEKKYKREPLSNEMEVKLREYFRQDIHLLEETIARDLSSWSKRLLVDRIHSKELEKNDY